jgi:hypothetical protein
MWRHRSAPIAIGVLAAATVASLAFAIVQRSDASDARRYAERLEGRLESARQRTDELEEQLEESGPDDASGEPDDAPGDGGSGDLFGDTFQGLLGDSEVLECIGGDVTGEGLEDLPSDEAGSPTESIKGLARSVERMRELRFSEPVEPELLPPAVANRHLIELFTQDYSRRDAEIEGRILESLGAIPAGTNLFKMRKDALSAGVAGFYDPVSGELVVKSPEGEFGAIEEVTLAHELEHALADQALGLQRILDEDPSPPHLDSALAGLAVVEGDATLLMQRYSLAALDFGDQLALAGDPSVVRAQRVLEESPPYIQAELLFPYRDGLEFVCNRYLRGGWEAVDRAYSRPPTTTAQVMSPELYRKRLRPAPPNNPGSLPDPWKREHAGSFGAAPLLWHLQAPGGNESAAVSGAEQVAESWGGGKLHLWVRREESAVGIALSERSKSGNLCEAVTDWLAATDPGATTANVGTGETLAVDGDDRDVVVTCPGDEVRAGIAPEFRLARRLVGGDAE